MTTHQMNIFVTGTDTNVGKTVVSIWLCLHTNHSYFKPIQTGTVQQTDSQFVKSFVDIQTYPEQYVFKAPLSPHLAASQENITIDIQKIVLPTTKNLVIEGAGGVFVPLNSKCFMIDLIKKFNAPVIIVARTTLGTINHTCLTIEALWSRDITILGVILNGQENKENKRAIEKYGKIPVLAEFSELKTLDKPTFKKIKLPDTLKKLFHINS
jgi:dethiobiotin synthetase